MDWRLDSSLTKEGLPHFISATVPSFLLYFSKAALDATDTIGISKDGKSRKATYYDHIHTLFSLYQLSEVETDIMRNLALAPLPGVQNRLICELAEVARYEYGLVCCHDSAVQITNYAVLLTDALRCMAAFFGKNTIKMRDKYCL